MSMIGTLKAVAISETQVQLNAHVTDWDGKMGFGVFRRTGASALVRIIHGLAADAEAIDSGLSPDTSYTYEMYPQIATVGGQPVFDYNALVASATVKTLLYISPSKPTLTATLIDDTTVQLEARLSSYGNPDTGSMSLRCKKDAGATMTIATTSSRTLSYTHRNLVEGSTYQYFVVADNGKTTPVYSEYKSITVPENGRIRVRINNEWKKGVPYVRQNGVWKKGKMYVRSNGAWNKGK